MPNRNKPYCDGSDTPDDPKILGSKWRSLMRPELESPFTIAQRRIKNKFGINLADDRELSDFEIYMIFSKWMLKVQRVKERLREEGREDSDDATIPPVCWRSLDSIAKKIIYGGGDWNAME